MSIRQMLISFHKNLEFFMAVFRISMLCHLFLFLIKLYLITWKTDMICWSWFLCMLAWFQCLCSSQVWFFESTKVNCFFRCGCSSSATWLSILFLYQLTSIAAYGKLFSLYPSMLWQFSSYGVCWKNVFLQNWGMVSSLSFSLSFLSLSNFCNDKYISTKQKAG